jgi:hypothetical protein
MHKLMHARGHGFSVYDVKKIMKREFKMICTGRNVQARPEHECIHGHALLVNKEARLTCISGPCVQPADNWVAYCTAYDLHLAHQRDIDMSIVGAEDIPVQDMSAPAQVLAIKVCNQQGLGGDACMS